MMIYMCMTMSMHECLWMFSILFPCMCLFMEMCRFMCRFMFICANVSFFMYMTIVYVFCAAADADSTHGSHEL